MIWKEKGVDDIVKARLYRSDDDRWALTRFENGGIALGVVNDPEKEWALICHAYGTTDKEVFAGMVQHLLKVKEHLECLLSTAQAMAEGGE